MLDWRPMGEALERQLSGTAARAMARFYGELPTVPRAEWPTLLHGMGYNFEFYDALFVLLVANVQLCLDEGDYTPRYRAMQLALLPFCSEFGIELNRGVQHTHRQLYAEFYELATGARHPERYGADAGNPWLATSRKWAGEMRRAAAAERGGALERARYSLGYFWAVERLSVDEFALMRDAWQAAGVRAPYLDTHCAVEEDHESQSTGAVHAFGATDDPIVAEAIRAHESHLAGYYEELLGLVAAHGRAAHT